MSHCGSFLRTNQATSTELYIATLKNAIDTAEVLKTFEIQQYVGFFVIAGLLELFTAYARPAKKSGGLIRGPVLLERAVPLERIRYYHPHNLQYHIRLCQKKCHKYGY